MPYDNYSMAVLIPCFNEEGTVQEVVASFRRRLPQAKIYVYDNNSTDKTAEIAALSGAIVRQEKLQGKGHVVRRMFADISSDIYILVDGDSTYPAENAPALINALLDQRLDMVVGARVAKEGAYRPYHGIGNSLFNTVVAWLFGRGMSDIFSGYRVFSRRFVKSFPVLSRGFEIETELSVHALELSLPYAEVPVPYLPRPQNSFSKLHTYKDGWRILMKILSLLKDTKPFKLFSFIACALLLAALALSYPLITTFLQTGLVPRFPTAIIVIGLITFSVVSFTSGIILEGIARLRRENRRLHYLRLDALP